jgi:diguanylate cyclase (GGDEF)-like protein
LYGVAAVVGTCASALALAAPTARDAGVAAVASAGLTAAMVVPVVLDVRSGRRTSSGPAVSGVLPFVLGWAWCVLAVVVAAVASGLHIRRYRTTPGGMALGASSVIVCAAAGAAVVRALLPAGVSPLGAAALAIVGAASYFAVGAAVLSVVGARWDDRHRVLPRQENLVNWVVAAVGAALAVASTPLLGLWALVVVAVGAAGAQRQRLSDERLRLAGVVALADAVRRCPSRDAVTHTVLDATRRLLHTPTARVGVPPATGEIGVAVDVANDAPGSWLVAGERHGHPPAYLGRYRPDELATLQLVAAVATGAWDTATLLEKATYEARHDRLTGVLNRAGMEEELGSRLEDAHRCGHRLGVLFVDLDNLKYVNDTYDHDVGDALIVESARRLTSSVGDDRSVGRWGGDEFVAIIGDDPGPVDLLAAAERIVDAFRRTVTLPNGAVVTATVSVGGVLFPDAATDLDGLLRGADANAIAVKRAGKNGHAVVTHAP